MRDALISEIRARYPDWAKITPAKRRILQFVAEQGGAALYFPGHVVRSLRPLRQLEFVGYLTPDYSERHTKFTLTDDGRAALEAA